MRRGTIADINRLQAKAIASFTKVKPKLGRAHAADPGAMRVSGPVTLATRNAGKLAGFRRCVAACSSSVRCRRIRTARGRRDQDSYLSNALKEARAIAAFTGSAADDSGLGWTRCPAARRALARYGGPDLDDAGRCARLLAALQGVRRSARFRCVLVLAQGDAWVSAERTFRGRDRGRTARQRRLRLRSRVRAARSRRHARRIAADEDALCRIARPRCAALVERLPRWKVRSQLH